MNELKHLLEKNRAWAESVRQREPEFFDKLVDLQTPEYLWIGCSDSRVPANQITGLVPGEVFVHRNVANLVVHADLNCLSVLQLAVDILKVKHIIVCGHYGCGGVIAAHDHQKLGLVDNWLCHVREVAQRHKDLLALADGHEERIARLCELNVIEQVVNVVQTTVVQDAWARAQPLTVHGWIYGIQDGLIRDLEMSASNEEDLQARYASAIS
jgi:carbonic anhydrase